MDSTWVFLIILAVVVCIAIEWFFVWVIVHTAKKRGRNGFVWGFWGFIMTFSVIGYFLLLIILLAIGDTEEKRQEKLREQARMYHRIYANNRRENVYEDEEGEETITKENSENWMKKLGTNTIEIVIAVIVLIIMIAIIVLPK